MTQNEAIIEAFNELGGTRSAEEIRLWVEKKYGSRWKDYGTSIADMVSPDHGGNHSSAVPHHFRVLIRVSRGRYRLLNG